MIFLLFWMKIASSRNWTKLASLVCALLGNTLFSQNLLMCSCHGSAQSVANEVPFLNCTNPIKSEPLIFSIKDPLQYNCCHPNPFLVSPFRKQSAAQEITIQFLIWSLASAWSIEYEIAGSATALARPIYFTYSVGKPFTSLTFLLYFCSCCFCACPLQWFSSFILYF